jgi:hypothetical protein
MTFGSNYVCRTLGLANACLRVREDTMKRSSRARWTSYLLGMTLLAVDACGSSSIVPRERSDGGQTAPTDATSDAFPDALLDASVVGCPESPTPTSATGNLLAMSFQLFLGDHPLIFGESNPLAGGGYLIPLNVRFYVSSVMLLRADNAPLPVDLVNSDGVIEPYGIHLFNAEEAASTSLRVRAPAGTYTGMSFLWGLDVGCNFSNAGERNPPLSAASGMTWPILGYLFLRMEGQLTDVPGANAGGEAAAGGVIAMGGAPGVPAAPRMQIVGPISVPAAGEVSRTVKVQVDQIFHGTTIPEHEEYPGPIPLPIFGPLLAGERLRQSAAGLEIFVLTPP